MTGFGKFLTGPIGSLLRVFVALVLGSYVTYLLNGGTFDGISYGDIQSWVGAALVVVLPVVIAAFNPQDSRFGKGS